VLTAQALGASPRRRLSWPEPGRSPNWRLADPARASLDAARSICPGGIRNRYDPGTGGRFLRAAGRCYNGLRRTNRQDASLLGLLRWSHA
jgi:hypothetical protein